MFRFKAPGIVIVLSTLSSVAGFEVDSRATVEHIEDGDTIKVSATSGFKSGEDYWIRFADIDAPESDTIEGQMATSDLESKLDIGDSVSIDVDDRGSSYGPYDRVIGVVYKHKPVNETHLLNLNEYMVSESYAHISDYDTNEFNPYSWSLYEGGYGGGEWTTVSIPDGSAGSGETVTVPINIDNVTDLGAANIELHYNPSVVNVDSISEGGLSGLTTSLDNSAGVAKMSWFSTSGKSGDFVFANVNLEAVGSNGDISSLNLKVETLGDVNGNSLPRKAGDGQFKVVVPLMEGDVDMNGCVNIVDAMYIAQHTVDKRSFNHSQMTAANTDDDEGVDIMDAMHIAQYTVGTPFKPLWQSPADDGMKKPVP